VKSLLTCDRTILVEVVVQADMSVSDIEESLVDEPNVIFDGLFLCVGVSNPRFVDKYECVVVEEEAVVVSEQVWVICDDEGVFGIPEDNFRDDVLQRRDFRTVTQWGSIRFGHFDEGSVTGGADDGGRTRRRESVDERGAISPDGGHGHGSSFVVGFKVEMRGR